MEEDEQALAVGEEVEGEEERGPPSGEVEPEQSRRRMLGDLSVLDEPRVAFTTSMVGLLV